MRTEEGTMAIQARLGRILFAIGFIALGIESLLLGIPVMRLELWLKAWPAAAPVGYISGAIVLVAGIALFLPRAAKLAASALAIVLLIWLIALHLPLLIPIIMHGDRWSGTSEVLAVLGSAWVLAALLPPHNPASAWQKIADLGIPMGRTSFGVALLVFAMMHFLYPVIVESLIPVWIPDHSFFAYATGAAHGLAGLAILYGALPRLAAISAGIMYGSWVLIVHIPRDGDERPLRMERRVRGNNPDGWRISRGRDVQAWFAFVAAMMRRARRSSRELLIVRIACSTATAQITNPAWKRMIVSQQAIDKT
jgi:uncharacterized membrane protein YphA (DoxX/SURF4 family)